MMIPFSGSYTSDEVQFLLTPLTFAHTSIAEKEALIQSGQAHYSQLLTHESLPDSAYIELFYQALTRTQTRIAQQLLVLARQLAQVHATNITLVSLARAGTPFGVLLKQILSRYFQKQTVHYSISILRDVGIDYQALRYIVERHEVNSIVFVDGWSAKGVIAQQLADSLAVFAQTDNIIIAPELAVLNDLSGLARFSASQHDELIPSCLLNATVSGLISRTVKPKTSSASQFHGCVYYAQFAEQDVSRYFVERILTEVAKQWHNDMPLIQSVGLSSARLQAQQAELFTQLQAQYALSHRHYLKLGIGEATRVLLRRSARCLLLQSADALNTLHLRYLAEQKAVPIHILPDSPYQALALIRELD